MKWVKFMICKKCGSANVNVQAVNEVKYRGCLASLFHIIMIMITFSLWLIIPLLRGGTRSKTNHVLNPKFIFVTLLPLLMQFYSIFFQLICSQTLHQKAEQVQYLKLMEHLCAYFQKVGPSFDRISLLHPIT